MRLQRNGTALDPKNKITYTADGKHRQVEIDGKRGKYIVREYLTTPPDHSIEKPKIEWWAIQLFGAVGAIAGVGGTVEEAVQQADA